MKYACADCYHTTDPYMLNDFIWSVISDGKRFLCLTCADLRTEDRLGRKLSFSDFTDARINYPIRFGLRLAERAP